MGPVMDAPGLSLINDSNCFRDDVRDVLFSLHWVHSGLVLNVMSEWRRSKGIWSIRLQPVAVWPLLSVRFFSSSALCLCRSLSHFRTVAVSAQPLVMVLNFSVTPAISLYVGRCSSFSKTLILFRSSEFTVFTSTTFSIHYSKSSFKIQFQTLQFSVELFSRINISAANWVSCGTLIRLLFFSLVLWYFKFNSTKES